ncbi:hypothetical protein [Sulfitobacter geojensis]|uniref:hypothetical protein n=1 Tax=Sulfitobacter geojensis TaxID=1342299 RepID=UPI0036DD418A
MIIGSYDIYPCLLETHNDSYTLSRGTHVSARRPFVAGGVILSILLGGFGMAFHDLLYVHEWGVLAASIAACLTAGLNVGQLTLVNRELRGSDLSTALWGTYGHLNLIRREIAAAIIESDRRASQ